jgi:hypothetical protein
MGTLDEGLKVMVLLEAIRKSGNSVPYPLSDEWVCLGDEIQSLITDGLLSFDSTGNCVISDDGKKVLILFDTERKEILSAMDNFSEFMIADRYIDARIPVVAFKVRKESNTKMVSEHLFCIATMIIWTDFFEMVRSASSKKESKWQESLFDSFYFNVKRLARPDAWLMLGRTKEEALITGTKLTNPLISKDLVQLTRQ